VTRGWRQIYNEELHNLYSSPIIRMLKSRNMGWKDHAACMAEVHTKFWLENQVLIGKSERRPLGWRMYRWENNIKIYLEEVGWKSIVWNHLAEDLDQWQAVVNTVMNLRIPQKRAWVTEQLLAFGMIRPLWRYLVFAVQCGRHEKSLSCSFQGRITQFQLGLASWLQGSAAQ
jgi:hypothetical protein